MQQIYVQVERGLKQNKNKHQHIYMYANITLTTWDNGIRHVA